MAEKPERQPQDARDKVAPKQLLIRSFQVPIDIGSFSFTDRRWPPISLSHFYNSGQLTSKRLSHFTVKADFLSHFLAPS